MDTYNTLNVSSASGYESQFKIFENVTYSDSKNENKSFELLFQVLVICSLVTIYLLNRKLANSKFKGKAFSSTIPTIKWGPIRLPFIDGIISPFQMQKNGQRLEKILANYGPEFTVNFPFFHSYVVSLGNPNHIQKFLGSSKPGHLDKPKYYYDVILTDYMKDGLVNAYHNVWQSHRKALNPAFAYKAFSHYIKFMINGAKAVVDHGLEQASKNSSGIAENPEIKPMIDIQLVKITSKMILGTDNNSLPDGEVEQFYLNYHKWKELSIYRILHPHLLVPPVWYLSPTKWQMDKVVSKMVKFELEIINHHRQVSEQEPEEKTKQSPNSENSDENAVLGVKPFQCMVERMIKAGMGNKEICDEIATVLVVGQETTSISLEMLIFHLASNPEQMIKCQEEIDELLCEKDGGLETLDMEDLSKLKYLERCILEGLRLTPVLPFFIRKISEPLELEDGLFLKPGEMVGCCPFSIHRNPELFPNPLVYDPDRFLPENVKARHPYAYIPFSMGPRGCIGSKIAIIEQKIFMAWILRHFTLTTTDTLDDVNLIFNMTIKPERLYNVKFHRRELGVKIRN